MGNNLLELTGVSAELQRKRIIDTINLAVPKRSRVSIIGTSGCGKSTLLKLIAGLLRAPAWHVTGQAAIEGKCFNAGDSATLLTNCGRQYAFIAQDSLSIFDPRLKIKEHFLEISRLRDGEKEEFLLQVMSLLRNLLITDPERVLESYRNELSGGTLQRISIAMGLIHKPRLLIADEPTSAIDRYSRAQLISVLKKVYRDTNLSMLIVSHDIDFVKEISDITYVMKQGKFIDKINTKELGNEDNDLYTRSFLRACNRWKKERLYEGS